MQGRTPAIEHYLRALPLQDRLTAHLEEIVRERDPYSAPEGHQRVREYIGSRLATSGRVIEHEFHHRGRTHRNLVLDLPGREDRGFVLIGAQRRPGVTGRRRNRTALAVLLELAAAFSVMPARRPMRLVAFDLEETNRSGSRAYAQEVRNCGEPLSLMVALEMLGYRDRRPGSQRNSAGGLRHLYFDRGDFIGLIGNLRTLPVLWRLARSMRRSVPGEFLPVPFRGRVLPDVRRSDHSSFWDLGYPAVMIRTRRTCATRTTIGRAAASRRSISSSYRPSAWASQRGCPIYKGAPGVPDHRPLGPDTTQRFRGPAAAPARPIRRVRA